MIDALLFAVQDAIRNAGFGYGKAECRVMDDGHPAPSFGNYFVAVHQLEATNKAENSLDEHLDFGLTLTMRVDIAPDRIGDLKLAAKLARRAGPNGSPSFNARTEQLRSFMHMNWGVLQDANQNLVNFLPDAQTVYGFGEPARWRTTATPELMGGDWAGASPEAQDVFLKAQLTFRDARRLQAIGSFA